jgi:hypothetical protein
MSDIELTQYGFEWGPMTVTRYAQMPNGSRVVGIEVDGKRVLEVYVSATGRSVRVFRKGHGEMKANR